VPAKKALGALVRLQNAAREIDHGVAVDGQRDRVGVALKQPPAGQGLQLADMLADGRLLQPQAAARPR